MTEPKLTTTVETVEDDPHPLVDNKYIVFKKEDWHKFVQVLNQKKVDVAGPRRVNDATVIRGQDVFAPPALEAYANAILCVVGVLGDPLAREPGGRMVEHLKEIADYFHQRAEESYLMQRKFPD